MVCMGDMYCLCVRVCVGGGGGGGGGGRGGNEHINTIPKKGLWVIF